MAAELTVGEKTVPLKIHGIDAPAPVTEGEPPVENGEEVLTIEEFQQKYPNIKLKVPIGGEEVIRTPKEFVDYTQRYQGLERTSERKAQETARLLAEVRQEVQELKTKAAPLVEPDDPNNPEHFVKGIVKAEVNPEITALKQEIRSLKDSLPDRELNKARNYIKQNDLDVSDFDNHKEPILDYFAKKIGREIEPKEVDQIPAAAWMQGYSHVKMSTKAKVEPKAKIEPEAKIVVKREGPSGGGGGYPRTEVTTNKELEEAQRTGDFSNLIMKRIKPRPEGE